MESKTDRNSRLSCDTEPSTDLVAIKDRLKIRLKNQYVNCLQDDDEARESVKRMWKKYRRYVGNAAKLSAFFDMLPFRVKQSALPKYYNEITQWCDDLFHIRSAALLCSTFYSETFQRVIRHAFNHLKVSTSSDHKAIIYVSMDFDPNLITDLTNSISNIRFEHIHNDSLHEDMIDVTQLQQAIERDLKETQSFPAIVIANAGTALLGRCDDLAKIKSICDQHHLWLHVIGDLLGSLALLPAMSGDQDRVTVHGHSVTLDIIKLFGIQNLPYLTFFLGSRENNDEESLTVDSLYDYVLHSPSINFLSVWSISERCSKEDILHHMKRSFELASSFFQRTQSIKTLRIINNDDQSGPYNYQRIYSSIQSNTILPKTITVFRVEPLDIPHMENSDNFYNYIDFLNLWFHEKLSEGHPKMNLELLAGVDFQDRRLDAKSLDSVSAHAIRFAPLEHGLDTIESQEMDLFIKDIESHAESLLATITARINFVSIVKKFERLRAICTSGWAGVGAVRYVPVDLEISNFARLDRNIAHRIDSIQAELARKLHAEDSTFSLGGGNDEHDSIYYVRLGMIKNASDLEILLEKISHVGQEMDISLESVDELADKIKMGIEKAKKGLKISSKIGLFHELPIVSNLVSWWSPSAPSSPVTAHGRSYNLNTDRVESTEELYVNRIQLQKQQQTATIERQISNQSAPVSSKKRKTIRRSQSKEVNMYSV